MQSSYDLKWLSPKKKKKGNATEYYNGRPVSSGLLTFFSICVYVYAIDIGTLEFFIAAIFYEIYNVCICLCAYNAMQLAHAYIVEHSGVIIGVLTSGFYSLFST